MTQSRQTSRLSIPPENAGSGGEILSRYGWAVVVIALAVCVRGLLHPIVGTKVPFSIFFAAIALTAWRGNLGPSLLAMILGAAAALTFFTQAFGSDVAWSLGGYFFTSLVMIWLGVAKRSAEGRAVVHAAQAMEREQRLTRVLEQMTDGFIVFDRQWRYVYLNDRAAQIIRKSKQEVLGKNVWELFPQNVGNEGYHELQRALRDQVPVHYETLIPELNAWVEVHAYPAPEGLSIFFADITARRRTDQALRESEMRNRAIFRAAMDGIITIDERGIIESLNPAAELLFGYGTGEAVGQNIGVFLPDVEKAGDFSPQAIGNGRELVGRRKDGSNLHLDLSLSEQELGGRKMFIGLVHDVTDRKQIEQQREKHLAMERAARSDAERANRMKDEFLATVSHELRTPLNAILGWAQLLRTSDGNGDDFRQGIETIERNARSQAQLVDDLLDMSRITSGRMRLEIERVNLADVIDAATESVKPAAAAKEIALQRDNAESVPAINGDASRLQQIVWNLLSNAIKFTPRGGRVTVRLFAEPGHVGISISDTGIGIKPDFMDHLFQRFRQADASITRRHGGLGIGLSICRHLVELHGGTLTAQSEGEDKGSTFTVQLPCFNPVAKPSAPVAGAEAGTQLDLAGVKVLVVDDEPDSRDLVKRMLSGFHAEVRAAASAAEAMQQIHSDPPHVLISDIGMPGEDGYALVRQIRALPPGQGGSIPALALTAFARAEDRTRAILSGFQAHLAKPVEAQELAANIALLTGRQSII